MDELNVSNRAVLSFRSAGGALVRFSIPRASMSKTAAAAREAMEGIIASGAVVTSTGIPAEIYSMELITSERRRIA